jgi:hypothetical protein
VKPCLDLATRSILEKVLDNIELLEEQSLLKNMDWEKLTTEMEEKLTIISLKPLQVTWPDLSTDRRNASFVYLCKELKIETKQSEEKISI